MLDIHTHILPGMDDGSKTVQNSLVMLECEAKQGVRFVTLTPHYHASRESPECFVKRRAAAEQALRGALAGREGMPELLAGAEVAYFDGMCRSDDTDMLCIADTNFMLIEMPFCSWNRRMLGELKELQQVRGIQPVLAHVERYMRFQPSGLIEQLGEDGILLQVNTSFFLRWQTVIKAMAMLKQRKIHFVASDCHNMMQRVPDLGAAVEKIERRLGAQSVAFLKRNAEALLGG